MDTLTHALSGALAGRAAGRRLVAAREPPPRVRAWVGFWAAAFPDVDFSLRLVDELLYLQAHRALTHSLVMLPLWALLLGGAFHLLYRRRYRYGALALLAGLGIAMHIAGDVITAYGTKILAPLSDYAPAAGWVLVIDGYLSALLVIALLASWRWPRPVVARGGLAVVAAFVLLQAALNHHARDIAARHAAAIGWRDAAVRAMAQPLSPFNRKLVIARDGEYRHARINLLRTRVPASDPDQPLLLRLYRSYVPVTDPGWERFALLPEAPAARALARSAWDSPALAPYRAFAHHPVFYGLDRDGRTCAWFTDLRYWYPPLEAPFRYGACRDGAGEPWRLHRLTWRGEAMAVAPR